MSCIWLSKDTLHFHVYFLHNSNNKRHILKAENFWKVLPWDATGSMPTVWAVYYSKVLHCQFFLNTVTSTAEVLLYIALTSFFSSTKSDFSRLRLYSLKQLSMCFWQQKDSRIDMITNLFRSIKPLVGNKTYNHFYFKLKEDGQCCL